MVDNSRISFDFIGCEAQCLIDVVKGISRKMKILCSPATTEAIRFSMKCFESSLANRHDKSKISDNLTN